MTVVYFDTETEPFSPGDMAPRLVILQFCIDDGILPTRPACLYTRHGECLTEDGGVEPGDLPRIVRHWLESGYTLVGHNVAFDMAVLAANYPDLLPLIFEAYRSCRITDTMLRAKLADIARGRYRVLNYDLGSVAHRYGFAVNKADPWRRRYRLLAGVPLDKWAAWTGTDLADERDEELGLCPAGTVLTLRGADAIRYALDDVLATRAAYEGQAANYAPELLADEFNQARKFFGLRLAEVWGIRTSERGVDELERGAAERRADLLVMLQEPWTDSEGREHPPLVRPDTLPCSPALKSGKPCKKCGGSGIRPNPKAGSRDTASAAVRLLDACREGSVRLTKTGVKLATEAAGGKITRELPATHPVFATEAGRKYASLDSDACNDSGDPLLEMYAEASSLGKILTNDVPALRRGMLEPIHTHFDLVETGRTSSAGPNIQNPRRIYGVRECFVPRGWVE